MTGHTVTPYELTAVRKYARNKGKEPAPLLLASLGTEGTVGLLDVVEAGLRTVTPTESNDKSTHVSCVAVRRDGDALGMVFAQDVSGEREMVLDPADPAHPTVVFVKAGKHVTRIHSCCML